MKRFKRMVVALAIILSGFALSPHVALPQTPFTWQQYAQAYTQP